MPSRWLLSGGWVALGHVVRSTRPTERLFGCDVDTRPNMCSMSSVVRRNVVQVRASQRVTGPPRVRGFVGVRVRRNAARPAIQWVARVALERRRQTGPGEAGAGDRPARRTAGGPIRWPRWARRVAGPRCRRSPTVRARRGSPPAPQQADAHPRICGRASSSAVAQMIGQVGRLGEGPLAGDRPEVDVADLTATVPRGRRRPSRPATPSAIPGAFVR